MPTPTNSVTDDDVLPPHLLDLLDETGNVRAPALRHNPARAAKHAEASDAQGCCELHQPLLLLLAIDVVERQGHNAPGTCFRAEVARRARRARPMQATVLRLGAKLLQGVHT